MLDGATRPRQAGPGSVVQPRPRHRHDCRRHDARGLGAILSHIPELHTIDHLRLSGAQPPPTMPTRRLARTPRSTRGNQHRCTSSHRKRIKSVSSALSTSFDLTMRTPTFHSSRLRRYVINAAHRTTPFGTPPAMLPAHRRSNPDLGRPQATPISHLAIPPLPPPLFFLGPRHVLNSLHATKPPALYLQARNL